MKKLTFVILFATVALICQAQSADEKVLLELEKQLTEAIASHKTDVLNKLFDDRYHGVTPAGAVVDKTKWLQLLNTNNPYIIFTTEDVKATVYGTTAVVTGKGGPGRGVAVPRQQILIGDARGCSVLGEERGNR